MVGDKDRKTGAIPWHQATALVHGGTLRSQFGETSEAIFLNSGYVYDSAEQAEARAPAPEFYGERAPDAGTGTRHDAGAGARARQAISKMTLPASPDLITCIASSAHSSGKRCVITGVGSNSPERRNRVIWCQVSYIRRPTTP